MKKDKLNAVVNIHALPATTQVAPYFEQIHELRDVGVGWNLLYSALINAGALSKEVKMPAFVCAAKKNKYASLVTQKRVHELDKLLVEIGGSSAVSQ